MYTSPTHVETSTCTPRSSTHVETLEGGEVIQLDRILSLPPEQPVGVALLSTVGLQEHQDVLSYLKHLLGARKGGREGRGREGGKREGGRERVKKRGKLRQ